MTEQQKTLSFVAVAAVMAAAGVFLAPKGPTLPKDSTEALIGTEFYKDFKNPSDATAIEVISYDPSTATASVFGVENQNGVWRIPSRHGYPADAKDRLAKAAASIIGLKREALVGKTEAEQAEFQVLDPKAEKAENLKGIGNRLTLKKENTVLADYIIGKQVPGSAGYYYVRRPDEKQTFKAKVQLDLSTKFTDWIESDVLNLDGMKLTELDILKHSLKISKGRATLAGKELSELSRKTSSDPWTLEGLDEATEEVNQDEVRKLVDALDNLKIVGVRPKPEALREGLKSEGGITLDNETESDLASRGFFFQPTPRGGLQMISMEGDLIAGTNEGVEYELHFGDVFEGTDEEVELGFAKPKEESAESSAGEGPDGEKKEDEQKEEAKSDSLASKKKSRFVFATARVNPELLGPKLEEPVKPEETPEAPNEEADKAGAKQEGTSDEKPADATGEKSAEAAKPEQAKDAAAADSKAASAEAMRKYEEEKARYDADVKTREEKLKTAEEKVQSLNARFADWYYVISAENFESLRPGRKSLVKEKAEAKPQDGEESPAPPTDAPATEKTPEEKQPEEKQPEVKEPEAKEPGPKSDASAPEKTEESASQKAPE
ncbi:MAG: DUF4340 domain-containing protein [Planctomycetaceae bacterium]